MFKLLRLGPHCTVNPFPRPRHDQLVHYVAHTVSSRAVGIRLKCLLVLFCSVYFELLSKKSQQINYIVTILFAGSTCITVCYMDSHCYWYSSTAKGILVNDVCGETVSKRMCSKSLNPCNIGKKNQRTWFRRNFVAGRSE